METAQLHAFTQQLLHAIGHQRAARIEPHEVPGDSDVVWLSFAAAPEPASADDEGDSLTITPWIDGTWQVEHNIHHRYGGTALVNVRQGESTALLPELLQYLHRGHYLP